MTMRAYVKVEGDADGAVSALVKAGDAIDSVTAKERHAAAVALARGRAAESATAAVTGETVALRANAVALQANAAAARMVAMQRQQMVFQLNDVIVSLASGMNPAMVAMQQGSQILQNGFGPAVKNLTGLVGGLVSKFWPLALAAGAIAAAVGGLTGAINENSSVQVSWGDTALAVFQTIGDGLYSLLKPAIDGVSQWFADAFSAIAQPAKDATNFIVGSFVGAVDTIKQYWGLLPVAIGSIVISVANGVLRGIADLIDKARVQINEFIGTAKTALGPIFGAGIPLGGIGNAPFNFKGLDNPYSEFLGKIGGDPMKAALGRDYVGELFGGIASRARGNALSRQDDDDDAKAAKAKRFRQELSALDQQAQQLASTVAGSLRDAWSGFFSDLFKNTDKSVSFFDRLKDSAGRALTQIGDQLLKVGSGMAFDALFGTVGSGKGKGSGILGNLAGLFASMLGGKGSALASGAMSALAPKMTLASIWHQGGWVGAGGPSRLVPASLFDHAPRYHNGLNPGEFAAILQEGERVIPRGGSAGTTVRLGDTHIDARGSSMGRAEFERILDERDRRWAAQLPETVRYINMHPRRG
jgi:hypothetical protein